MPIIYNILIHVYSVILSLVANFHNKAKLFVEGRKKWQSRYANLNLEKLKNKEVIWMHCASLGELEQGKPILEALKNKYPNYAYIITFYSPSGYEYKKNYEGADLVLYLPIDTAKNAEDFVSIFNIKLALFVKYEFWYNYINTLSNKNIPIIHFSVLMQENQIFFKWYGSFFKTMLQKIDFLFVQNEHSLKLLNNIGINQVAIAGDTRFDSAFLNTLESYTCSPIENWIENKKVLLIGSSWPSDDIFISQVFERIKDAYTLIIAPHDINKERINFIVETFKNFNIAKFSELASGSDISTHIDILIIDSIGQLKYLYRYANAIWIGGGFEKGIHNTVEAAVYGKPIFFGNKYQRFQEAIDLINLNGAMSIKNDDALKLCEHLKNDKALSAMGDNALEYAKQQRGATDIILNYVVVKYFSTNI